MYETQIIEILQKDGFTKKIFIGIFARDELPTNIKYPSCFIFNTKPRNHSGEHWLALYFDEKGNAFFFDSYGNHPSAFNMETYLNKFSNSWTYNKIRIQGNSSYCGYYCIIFLLLKARLKSHIFFRYFNKNYYLNDKKVYSMIKKYEK